MAWYGWILLVLALIAALYLWLIAPKRKHPDASALAGKLYAHRGLHELTPEHVDENTRLELPENSMAAFANAVSHGYGIELDVQLTADKRLIVHHDGNTKRVCGVDCVIRDVDYADLPKLPNGEAQPLFADVLKLVNGQVPLIVEVKQYGSPTENAQAALDALAAYRGPFCMESFHPLIVRYLRKHAPQIVRGQLAMGGAFNKNELNMVEHFALKHLLVNCLGRPHFVAYSVAVDHNLSMWLMKRLYKPLLAAWTIRDQPLLDYALRDYDMPIFELFTPKER